MNRLIPIMIGLLALAGLADSAYLSLVHYGIVNVEAPLPAEMCQIQHSSSCGAVLQAKQATLFGVPNSMLGLAYFAMLFGAVSIRLVKGKWTAPWLMLALVGIGLAFSGYLVYAMLFQIRNVCPYCMMAHGINAALAALYVTSMRL